LRACVCRAAQRKDDQRHLQRRRHFLSHFRGSIVPTATAKSDTVGNFFDMSEDELRATTNSKWHRYGPDILPAFVAEMDFRVAEPIQRAIRKIVDGQDYGYSTRLGGKVGLALGKAFSEHMQARFGWAADPELVQPVADLVQGTFATVLAFSDPGDGVVLQVPNYPPFRDAIGSTGRQLIPLAMRDDGTRHVCDVGELAGKIDRRTRIFVLCNPQNPTGRVFSREELLAFGRFAIEHDLVVVADEIHADLVYPGHKHVPFATLGPEFADRTVTLTSATKSYNIPGLRSALLHFGSAALRERFHQRIPPRLMGDANAIGVDATVAAWAHGKPWLDAVMAHLLRARDHLVGTLRSELPQVRVHAPEATYLAWVDCSALGLNVPAFDFFHDQARVAFSAGETFDPACAQFVRFNFATSMPILDQLLDRTITAARKAGIA
jgi:cystathionine beta-lyase